MVKSNIDKHISVYAILSISISVIGLIVPFIASIGGIILGHVVRKRCKTNIQLSGSGIALAGLIIGYAGLFYHLFVFAFLMYVYS